MYQFRIFVVICVSLFVRVNGDQEDKKDSPTESAFDYLYDVLLKSGNKEMCSMIKDVETDLKALDEFTLFTPSDEAFALLPGSLLEEMRNDPTKRKEFVLNHVVPGQLMLRPLQPFEEIRTSTVEGSPLHVTAYPNGFVVNGATVLDGDKKVKNSSNIIHYIDRVLYPPPRENLVELLETKYSQMYNYLKSSGLEADLSRSTFTCFAPTDEAFRALPWSITEKMLTNQTFLKLVISNHLVPGSFYSLGLNGNQIYSIGGEKLSFEISRVQSQDMILVNSIPIVKPDEVVKNGVCHGISRLLIPKKLMEDCKCDRTTTTTDSTVTSFTDASTQTVPTTRGRPVDTFFRRSPIRDSFNRRNSLNNERPPDAPYLIDYSATPSTVRDELGSVNAVNSTVTPFFFTELYPTDELSTVGNDRGSGRDLYGTYDPTRRPKANDSTYYPNTPATSNPTRYPTTIPTTVPTRTPRYRRPPQRSFSTTTPTTPPAFTRTTLSEAQTQASTRKNQYETPLKPEPPYEYSPESELDRDRTTRSFRNFGTTTVVPTTRSLRRNRPATRVIEDETTPSTIFFDSTRRPTTPRFGRDNRSPANATSTTRRPSRETESQYVPLGTSTTIKPSLNTTPRSRETEYETNVDPQTIQDVILDPGLELNGKPVTFKIFNDCMRRAGLANLLSTPGPFTLFLPTDDAFKRLPLGALRRLQQNPNQFRNFLLRHITNFVIVPNSLRRSFNVQTLSSTKLPIEVETTGKRVLVMGNPIMAATVARNGAIYVIDAAFYEEPINDESETIAEKLKTNPELTKFTQIVRLTPFMVKLSGRGPITVLVPDNKALSELSPDVQKQLERSPRALQKLVGNHIIDGAYNSEQLKKNGLIISNNPGKPLKFTSLPGTILVNNMASLMKTNIATSNGFIHTINHVIVPDDILQTSTTPVASSSSNRAGTRRKPEVTSSGSVRTRDEVQKASKNSRFLRDVQRSAGITEIITSGQNVSIVVPSDEAIEELPEKIKSTMDSNPTKLKSLFNYHIILQHIDFNSIQNDDVVPTLSGKPIRFNSYRNNTVLTLSGGTVQRQTTENNIQLIFVDKVLYPPQGTVRDIIKRSPILQILDKLVTFASLDKELAQQGGFTMFAPSDEAFKKLPSATKERLETDPDYCRGFLLRHIVPYVVFSSASGKGKTNQTEVVNARSEKLRLEKTPDNILISGINLAYADITATNGVCHVIEETL